MWKQKKSQKNYREYEGESMSKSYSPEFKIAATSLLLNIVQKIDTKKRKQYYKIFQKKLNIRPEEFDSIKERVNINTIVLSEKIAIIQKELEFKQFEIMSFLMMLNQCIILDGCDMESYSRFEYIRDSFMEHL